MDLRSPLLGGTSLAQLGYRNALGVGLLVGMEVFPDLNVKFFAERVDAGDAHTMQAA